MYCYHCGKRIRRQSSFVTEEGASDNATVAYVCPRCGHLIHEGCSYEDSKELSRASHAQIQRGNNSFATGMSLSLIGIILLAIGILFYVLAKKPSKGYVLQTDCAEFVVFIVLTSISVILLGFGIYLASSGLFTRRHYTKLLKDINNKTFIQ